MYRNQEGNQNVVWLALAVTYATGFDQSYSIDLLSVCIALFRLFFLLRSRNRMNCHPVGASSGWPQLGRGPVHAANGAVRCPLPEAVVTFSVSMVSWQRSKLAHQSALFWVWGAEHTRSLFVQVVLVIKRGERLEMAENGLLLADLSLVCIDRMSVFSPFSITLPLLSIAISRHFINPSHHIIYISGYLKATLYLFISTQAASNQMIDASEQTWDNAKNCGVVGVLLVCHKKSGWPLKRWQKSSKWMWRRFASGSGEGN